MAVSKARIRKGSAGRSELLPENKPAADSIEDQENQPAAGDIETSTSSECTFANECHP